MIRLPDASSQFIPEDDFTGDDYRFELDEFEVDYMPDAEPELDVHQECRNFFAPGGKLASIAAINGRPAEERPQQLSMALAIADALQKGVHPNGCQLCRLYHPPNLCRHGYHV